MKCRWCKDTGLYQPQIGHAEPCLECASDAFSVGDIHYTVIGDPYFAAARELSAQIDRAAYEHAMMKANKPKPAVECGDPSCSCHDCWTPKLATATAIDGIATFTPDTFERKYPKPHDRQ